MGGWRGDAIGGRAGWGDLISGGKFLMQGDPREIRTVGLITGDAAGGVYLHRSLEVQVKREPSYHLLC